MRRIIGALGTALLITTVGCGGSTTKTVTVASTGSGPSPTVTITNDVTSLTPASVPSTSGASTTSAVSVPVAATAPETTTTTADALPETMTPTDLARYNDVASRWDNAETEVNTSVKNKCRYLIALAEYSAGLDCISNALKKWGPVAKSEIAEITRISKAVDPSSTCSSAAVGVLDSLKAYVRTKRAFLHNVSNLQAGGANAGRLNAKSSAYGVAVDAFKSACA